MKKIFSTIILVIVIAVNFTPTLEAKNLPCNKWVPTGSLSEVPFYESCKETNGDIAVAKTSGIYWCSSVAQSWEAEQPGITHFYFVHEYGHYVMGSNEFATDCWAAKQLAGTCYIPIAIQHFMKYGNQSMPGYGTMRDRARNIAKCAAQ